MLDGGAVPHSTDKKQNRNRAETKRIYFLYVSALFRSVHIQWTDAVKWINHVALQGKWRKNDDDVCVAAAGFMFLTSHVSEQKQETPLGEASTEIMKNMWRLWTTGGFAEWSCWIEWKTVIDFQGFYFRISSEDFENFVCLVGPAVTKKKTNFRDAISVTERLAIILRYPATVDSYHSV